MPTDRHRGRGSPTFVVKGHPDKFINLINLHGILCRIQQARKCACGVSMGSPNMYCPQCHGDGYVYNFQRKLLQADEDSDVMKGGEYVKPFRIPILQPVRIERLLPPEQKGGIKEYRVVSFDSEKIKIAGSSLPTPYEKMRVSYYFDRYDKVSSDQVDVDETTHVLTMTQTRYDDEHDSGNIKNIHGDLTEVLSVKNTTTGFEYSDFTFRKNKIYLHPGQPAPVKDQIYVDYYYAPPTRGLPMDLDSKEDYEKWTSSLSSGNVRFGFEPWYEFSQGDLVTALSSVYWRSQVIAHSSHGFDVLNEFDINQVADEIIDEDGIKYYIGTDFYLRRFREIAWVGRQPQVSKNISVKYAYHPTYIVFQDNPVPNNMENQEFPQVIFMKLWNKANLRDIEQTSGPEIPQAESQKTDDHTGSTFILPGNL